jgi:hypothetical protein
MAAASDGQRSERNPTHISLDGRGPHEGILGLFTVVMIVVAILFVIAVVSGALVDMGPEGPDRRDAPPAETTS